MKNQIKIVILGLLVSIFIFIFYFGLGSNTKNNPQVMVFKKLPAIELRSLYDNNIKISLPRINQEKFYIINIWASWCTPCRGEEHWPKIDCACMYSLFVVHIRSCLA